MTDTSPGPRKGTRPETRTQPRVKIMAISVRQDPKTRPDGGLYIYHALAFSTLLSSQETDALRSPNFRSSLAATLLIYPGFPSCQIGSGSKYSNLLPDLAFRVFPEPSAYSLLGAVLAHTWLRAGLLAGGSPGPGPPCGVPSPSGQDEPYGSQSSSSNRS
jgi:hypothetical protein